MYRFVSVKLTHLSLFDLGDIFIIHILINKLKVSIFIIVVIFFLGCVIEVVVPPYPVGVIYIPRKLVLFIVLLCNLMMCANNRIHYGPMVVFLCLYFGNWTPISKYVQANFDDKSCRFWLTGCVRSHHPIDVNSRLEERSWKALMYLLDGMNIWYVFTISLFIFQRNAFTPLKSIGISLFTSAQDVWNPPTSGASRHFKTGELPLKQRPNHHKVWDFTKKLTELLKRAYIVVT